MSRASWQLRDAALGYASRGIPVLPLHYPLPHRDDLQPIGRNRHWPIPAVGTGCSCRDPGCGQPAKHPLGTLVPHGVKEATTNRARVLAWWTRHPQANIGLATGHDFDVLDVDGPAGAQAIRTLAATHGLQSSGPLVRTGGGGWHYYLAATGLGNVRPAGLAHVDWRGRGGYVVAPPSRHHSSHPYQWATGRDLDTPLAQVPASCWSGWNADRRSDPPARWRFRPSAMAHGIVTPRRPWPRNSPGSPPPPSASATTSCGNRPATSTTSSPPAPSTTATSTRGCWMPPNAAGCWLMSRARRAEPWLRAARSAWPIPAAQPTPPAPNAAMPRHRYRLPNPSGRGGDGHGRRWPAGRLSVVRGVGACRRQAEPAPTLTTRRKEPAWAATPP
jgi:Bifunctional DNA primase/polymerase, N-terminal